MSMSSPLHGPSSSRIAIGSITVALVHCAGQSSVAVPGQDGVKVIRYDNPPPSRGVQVSPHLGVDPSLHAASRSTPEPTKHRAVNARGSGQIGLNANEKEKL